MLKQMLKPFAQAFTWKFNHSLKKLVVFPWELVSVYDNIWIVYFIFSSCNPDLSELCNRIRRNILIMVHSYSNTRCFIWILCYIHLTKNNGFKHLKFLTKHNLVRNDQNIDTPSWGLNAGDGLCSDCGNIFHKREEKCWYNYRIPHK